MEHIESKSIGKWISILHRQAQIYINRELKAYNINSSEYFYLANLTGDGEGCNQKYLSDLNHIDDALTTRVLKKLEEKGFIFKVRSQKDKRAYHIHLTNKGIEIQPKVLAVLRKWTEIISEGMDEMERDAIIKTLMLMSENALRETKGK